MSWTSCRRKKPSRWKNINTRTHTHTHTHTHTRTHTHTTQAVVGADLLFLNVATGFPGSSHDARNLRNTSLFRKSESREILSKPGDAIKSSKIKPLIVGDGAYPLLPWLLAPFQHGPALTRHEKNSIKSCPLPE